MYVAYEIKKKLTLQNSLKIYVYKKLCIRILRQEMLKQTFYFLNMDEQKNNKKVLISSKFRLLFFMLFFNKSKQNYAERAMFWQIEPSSAKVYAIQQKMMLHLTITKLTAINNMNSLGSCDVKKVVYKQGILEKK